MQFIKSFQLCLYGQLIKHPKVFDSEMRASNLLFCLHIDRYDFIVNISYIKKCVV